MILILDSHFLLNDNTEVLGDFSNGPQETLETIRTITRRRLYKRNLIKPY